MRTAMVQLHEWVQVMVGRVLARPEDDERGAPLVEYAFLVGLIAVVCLLAITFFGTRTSGKFSSVASSVGSAG